ncbi:MAG: ATP-binding protein [Steroidobacteraceae bacterium]|nr:HAMP domain-containing protein [Nevskiaceae bacterium]MCP5472964.1 HAMP domain-containing protein [Nevskiaceae bacterium]
MKLRFDTLRVKLFLAIAGANVVLVAAAFLIYGWSFEQGLGDYLHKTEEARLDPVVVRLADGYRQQYNWHWLTDDRRSWSLLLREELGSGRAARGGRDDIRRTDSGSPYERDPPPAPPITMDPRLMLLDADGSVLIGMAERAADAVRRPIAVDGRTVGYLAYVPRLQVVESLERVFSAEQNRRFGAIAIGLLAAVLVNAALIAHWLSRRLNALSAGAAALAQGHYATRLDVHGDDELERLAGDFNRLAGALEAAQQARQQWIADIAHELRTPLTTLRAEIEALEDGVRPLSREGLSSLAQETNQLMRLVEDLRMLSLSDLGALSYHKEPLPLAEVVEDCLASQRAAIHDKPLHVETTLDPALCVDADADRLMQVFGNLLQNTLRYTDAPATLHITLAAEADAAVLRWEDSAPGVPADDLPHLTDRLYRVDGSRARSSGGSGLGLAIVAAIVQAHDGRITAEASPMGGLRWVLHLPLATPVVQS